MRWDFTANNCQYRRDYEVWFNGNKLNPNNVYWAEPGKWGSVNMWSHKKFEAVTERGCVELVRVSDGSVITA